MVVLKVDIFKEIALQGDNSGRLQLCFDKDLERSVYLPEPYIVAVVAH